MPRIIFLTYALLGGVHAFRGPSFHLSRSPYPLRVASFDITNTESQSTAETPLAKPLGTLTEYYKQIEAEKKAEAVDLEPLVPVVDPSGAERFTGRLAMIAWAAILVREALYGLSVAEQFNGIVSFLHL